MLVSRLLSSHPRLLHNPDFTPSGLSNTNLHLAASLGHLDIVTLLLEAGHERDGLSLNEDHQTPLMLASMNGHAEVVHKLCECGSGFGSVAGDGDTGGDEKPNNDGGGVARRDRWGRDAVMYASRGGWDTCLQILLTYAPEVPSTLSKTLSQTSSTSSSSDSDTPTAAQLLLRNADMDGNTALHFASSNGHLLVLRTLLAAGADAERRNVWSWTAMSYSATVAAEVYFKGLVAEVERRKGVRSQVEREGKGGGLRLVGSGED